jgi:hypothetical protein
MAVLSSKELKKKVIHVLKIQGYKVGQSGFVLKNDSMEVRRNAHVLAKAERMNKSEDFIVKNIELIKEHLVDGNKIDINKINPQIIEVTEGTKYEKIFRWWNIVWWSLPYEHAYGRQMRFIIWDKYHNAPIGLIGLQSPILSWSVRDKYLGIKSENRDFWINQSMSAQRLGALPPYNYLLGGKLVASLMTADSIRKKFKIKYDNQKTLIKKRKLPSDLLFITTTGAYGKSSVYNRLKFNDELIASFIGYSKGSGSFHIPNTIFEEFIKYLKKRDYNVGRGYGNGPSRKMRLINQTMECLGIENGSSHGIQRAIYLFPLVKNINEVIQNGKRPIWYKRSTKELTDYWKKRWAIPRISKNKEYLDFFKDKFISETYKEIEKFKRMKK